MRCAGASSRNSLAALRSRAPRIDEHHLGNEPSRLFVVNREDLYNRSRRGSCGRTCRGGMDAMATFPGRLLPGRIFDSDRDRDAEGRVAIILL